MESITVYVQTDNTVKIVCPYCGLSKRISIEKFLTRHGQVVARCVCKNRFKVRFNSRKYYRKRVDFDGEVQKQPSNNLAWSQITVCNLSMSGLLFKKVDRVVINEGDEIRIRFALDKKHSIIINKKAIVRSVNDGFYGCEFLDLAFEEKDLGFFLFN